MIEQDRIILTALMRVQAGCTKISRVLADAENLTDDPIGTAFPGAELGQFHETLLAASRAITTRLLAEGPVVEGQIVGEIGNSGGR